MKNKIRPKFHFLTKIEIKMTHLVVLFCLLQSLASRAIWKPFLISTFKILSCTNNKK